MVTTNAVAVDTRNGRTPSRQPTPGGSPTDITDLITVKPTERQTALSALLLAIYTRVEREAR